MNFPVREERETKIYRMPKPIDKYMPEHAYCLQLYMGDPDW